MHHVTFFNFAFLPFGGGTSVFNLLESYCNIIIFFLENKDAILKKQRK